MHRNPISAIVTILMAIDDIKQSQLAEPAGCSPATISRRLAGGGWSADELDGLARFFGVPVSTFFKSPVEVRQAVIAGYVGDAQPEQMAFALAS
jgi:transcriptional regulator with XRE-family HTH domain